METRIRHYRKIRGWTLQALADRIGTTAQTIQRLETSNMTVSTDWLERIGDALGVPPIALMGGETSRSIPLIGVLGKQAILQDQPAAGEVDSIEFDVPAEDPVAVRLTEAAGPYALGSLLIANKLKGQDMNGAIGKDGLVQITSGPVVLRRVIKGAGDTFTLVPLSTSGDVRYDQEVDWIARIVMRVEYL